MPERIKREFEALGVETCQTSWSLTDCQFASEVIGAGATTVIIDSYEDFSDVANAFRANRIATVTFVDHDDQAVTPTDVFIRFSLQSRIAARNKVGVSTELRGIEWVPIRRQITDLRNASLDRREDLVLVSIGGTDPLGIESQLVEVLLDLGLEVVVGAKSPGGQVGKSLIDDFPLALATSAVAIVGCGITVWEALCLGTPIVPVLFAANQEDVSDVLRRSSIGNPIRIREEVNGIQRVVDQTLDLLRAPDKRAALSVLSCGLIDGQGGDRLVERLGRS